MSELLLIIESRGTLDDANRRKSLEQSQLLEVTVTHYIYVWTNHGVTYLKKD